MVAFCSNYSNVRVYFERLELSSFYGFFEDITLSGVRAFLRDVDGFLRSVEVFFRVTNSNAMKNM